MMAGLKVVSVKDGMEMEIRNRKLEIEMVMIIITYMTVEVSMYSNCLRSELHPSYYLGMLYTDDLNPSLITHVSFT